jgi:cytochrome c oxidase cbb3-type subunit 3
MNLKSVHRTRAPLPLALLVLSCSACSQREGSAANPAAPAAAPAVVYTAHLAAGGEPPPGATLRNPHEGDAAIAKNGALLFTAMNCDGCHGADAAGAIGPNLGDGRWRYGGADSEVFMSIYYGRPKGMPAFGGVLGADGVWKLVTYLRSLPVPANLPTESWEQP